MPKTYIKEVNSENLATELQQVLKKEMEWIPLTKWPKYFAHPSYGTMRNVAARRKENGAEAFFSMVNSRLYVHIPGFNQWMQEQKG